MNRFRPLIPLTGLAIVAVGLYYARLLGPHLAAEYREAAAFHPLWGYFYLGATSLAALSVLALVAAVLWMLWVNTRRQAARRAADSKRPSEMTAPERQTEIGHQLAEVHEVAAALPAEARNSLERSAEAIEAKQTSQKLEIVACGAISSGKSSLLNALAGRDVFKADVRGGTTLCRNEIPWPGVDRVTLVDAPGLEEFQGAEREAIARLVARDADLVLFVLDGPIRDFEYAVLELLARLEKRIVVCVNKTDCYRAEERDVLRRQVCEQVASLVPQENVLLVRARASERVRVRIAPDGSEVDERIHEEPDLNALAERLLAIVDRDGRDLLLANLLLRSRGLAAAARALAQDELDRRARAIVDRTMWQVGAAAALSPLPVIDLAASIGLSTKMVLELARVYRQPMTLDSAAQLLGQLAKHLVSVTGVSIAGPAAGAMVASVLKTVPGVGMLAGGVLQGLVQALVTRWIGRIFIQYFRAESQEPPQGWGAVAREQWNALTRPAELAEFVRVGIKQLLGKQAARGDSSRSIDTVRPGETVAVGDRAHSTGQGLPRQKEPS